MPKLHFMDYQRTGDAACGLRRWRVKRKAVYLSELVIAFLTDPKSACARCVKNVKSSRPEAWAELEATYG